MVDQEEGQREDQGASLEELGVDPVVEVQSLVDLASVEVLESLGQLEGADAGWPSGGAGCHLVAPYPLRQSHLIHLYILLLLRLLPPLQELTDLKTLKKNNVTRNRSNYIS